MQVFHLRVQKMGKAGTEKNQQMKPKIVYQPEYQETQMEKFRKFVEKKYNLQLGK